MSTRIDSVALSVMQGRGGSWAVYENKTIDSHNCGHLQFLKVGPGCTYLSPPMTYPADTPNGMGWRYVYVGNLNLDTGVVEEVDVGWNDKSALALEDKPQTELESEEEV